MLDVEETGSAARNDRPGFERVLQDARRGTFDALLVFKLDRAGRSALDLLANIRELVDVHGVRFLVTSQGLDLKPGGDGISRLLMTVLGAVAEFERDLIRDRTRLGLAAARRRGSISADAPCLVHRQPPSSICVRRVRAGAGSPRSSDAPSGRRGASLPPRRRAGT
ncbi:MAG: hypothetical protein A2W26_05680 [Acidobacteria bacterium RBG_16_64_8]|nr:MAG: hypothetical protein A2W26_05680 [Acidobacteria bacterium RBG_16_64_8]